MKMHSLCAVLPAGLVAAALANLAGCSKNDGTQTATPSPAGPKLADLVDFPVGIRSDDPSVNDFLMEAIRTCVAEDYEAFRLLWSAREEPIAEPRFRRAWRACRKVSVQELKKIKLVRTGDGTKDAQGKMEEIVYVVRGHVRLDPNEVPEPERDIILLLVRENEKWRLATVPRKVKESLVSEVAGAEKGPGGTEPATRPADGEP